VENYFYEDEKKTTVKSELLNEKAKEIAQSFFGKDRRGNIVPGLTSAQLRRFYTEVKSIDKRLETAGDKEKKFKELFPLIKMLKSKVAYASNPRKRRVPDQFRKFIDDSIDKVIDKKDFDAFVLQFEAVVGYFYGEGVKT